MKCFKCDNWERRGKTVELSFGAHVKLISQKGGGYLIVFVAGGMEKMEVTFIRIIE
jgi:hypothetical protein